MKAIFVTSILFSSYTHGASQLSQDLEALAADDACFSEQAHGDSESCDLSLRQLRGELRARELKEADAGTLGLEEVQADEVAAEVQQALADGVRGHPDPSKAYPTHKGFTLALVEEFNEPIDLDNDPIWTWSDGGLSEGQVRFVKEQIKFSDGKMKIVAEPNPGIPTQPCSHAEVGEVSPKPLVSGEFRARYNQFRYGRYEVRMKAPTVAHGNPFVDGNFITTMFVYKDGKFKHWREIDFEITGDSPHSVTTNMLNANGVSNWKPGIQETKEVHVSGNVRAEFHTYAFEWLPNKITWYIDGKQVREQRGGLPIPEHAGKIMMNLWIFNDKAGFGGPKIHNNRYPMAAEYDWFRFYKWDGDKHYPCTSLGPSCLTADDHYLAANNPCDGIVQNGMLHGQSVCHATCHR